jgi:predicted ATPase
LAHSGRCEDSTSEALASALPRQKTLGALIDWSYDLLTPQEQMLFNRVGIFAGGFSLDAVTAVCTGDGIEELDVLDLLASLTDKSLVVADTTSEGERYRLLESTRAYALEKLTGAGGASEWLVATASTSAIRRRRPTSDRARDRLRRGWRAWSSSSTTTAPCWNGRSKTDAIRRWVVP